MFPFAAEKGIICVHLHSTNVAWSMPFPPPPPPPPPPHSPLPVQAHLSTCTRGSVVCGLCGMVISFMLLPTHEKDECPLRLWLCVHCTASIPISEKEVSGQPFTLDLKLYNASIELYQAVLGRYIHHSHHLHDQRNYSDIFACAST